MFSVWWNSLVCLHTFSFRFTYFWKIICLRIALHSAHCTFSRAATTSKKSRMRNRLATRDETVKQLSYSMDQILMCIVFTFSIFWLLFFVHAVGKRLLGSVKYRNIALCMPNPCEWKAQSGVDWYEIYMLLSISMCNREWFASSYSEQLFINDNEFGFNNHRRKCWHTEHQHNVFPVYFVNSAIWFTFRGKEKRGNEYSCFISPCTSQYIIYM